MPALDIAAYDFALAGSPYRWGDYEVGEKIDHVDGMTLEEAEHQIATRLYQNTAKVHFNQHTESKGRFGKRIVYGGVVISLARALSFNGLNNAFHLAAINGGRHVAPLLCRRYGLCLVGGPGKGGAPGPHGCRRARTRLVAVKNQDCAAFPFKNEKGEYVDGVMLDLDIWLFCRGRAPIDLTNTCRIRAPAILAPFFRRREWEEARRIHLSQRERSTRAKRAAGVGVTEPAVRKMQALQPERT